MNRPWKLLAATVAGAMILFCSPVAVTAQDDVTTLRQKNNELEEKIRALENENQSLKQKKEEAPPAQATEESLPPSITQIEKDNDEYQFLKLGQHRNYLEAERWRMVNQIEQAIPPLYEPILPFHGYTLPPGVWRFGLNTTYGYNPGDFGTDKFYSKFFEHVKVDFLQVDYNIFYGFEIGPIKDLTLGLNVPYKFIQHNGTGHPFRIDTMLMTMEGSGKGVGDVSLTLKKKWVDQANDSPVTFSTMMGLIFPTAEDNQQFNASQTIFMNGMAMPVSAFTPGNPAIDIFGRKPGDRLFPRGAQPGNGSWGGRFGFGLTHQFSRSALHGGAIYDLLADSDGIIPGDELKYGLSYVFPPLQSDLLSLDLSIFGRWKGDEKFPGTITHPERNPATGGPIMDGAGNIVMFTTGRPDFKHGNVLFFSPSLTFLFNPNTRIFVSPALRIIEPDQGPSPNWTVSTGITYTF